MPLENVRANCVPPTFSVFHPLGGVLTISILFTNVNGDEVIITWWERNQTSNEPVFRASVDNGLTFGPLLKLGTNGTIGANE